MSTLSQPSSRAVRTNFSTGVALCTKGDSGFGGRGLPGRKRDTTRRVYTDPLPNYLRNATPSEKAQHRRESRKEKSKAGARARWKTPICPICQEPAFDYEDRVQHRAANPGVGCKAWFHPGCIASHLRNLTTCPACILPFYENGPAKAPEEEAWRLNTILESSDANPGAFGGESKSAEWARDQLDAGMDEDSEDDEAPPIPGSAEWGRDRLDAGTDDESDWDRDLDAGIDDDSKVSTPQGSQCVVS